jgi:Ca2+-binding EF-hand superfamily protein
MDDSELQIMIERADTGNEGKVFFDDFYNILAKKPFA